MGMAPHHSSHEHWKTARVKTLGMVKVKQKLLHLHSLARNTALMRNKSESEKARYVLMIIVVIVVLGAATAMTKSAMFHMNAIGRWDNGHPYKFSYALSLTFVVFLIKLCLVFVRICKKEDEDADGKDGGTDKQIVEGAEESESDDEQVTISDRIMPWVLLFGFTTFEMLSGTVASLGLLYGAPTSMFVVFKSSKTIFLAVMSVVILGRKLCGAQWLALLLISVSLGIATIAEGKGEGKGEAAVSLMGPALLLLSELFHATMLVLQEIAVKNYWSDPLALLSASAAFGVVLTGFAAYKAHFVMVTLPDGGQRPASDAYDSVIMCMNNPALGAAMLLHLFAHVTSDVSHIVILKHISALARTLCDAVKLILMWFLGKLFWVVGIFPMLAEAWHPGFVGSWLMLPAIGIIIYAMLMFKNATYYPIKLRKHHTHIDIEEDVATNREKLITANLDDDFYTAMFRKKSATVAKTRRNRDPLSLFKTARILTKKGMPALQRAFSRV
eukprot:CAMPEP_0176081466 /NCGR_PEP_ID=MMETSP0120_2-20121206/40751_1 /TAXON_ID=160619 /ORGANISM="Kryptoperidinium foliaceum, Strain CCMP 1326" /LENGTH=499 /DNA_ID=CAMNT_0017415235 /DNA_START=136 /DNA_END=1635 /DNA_ORIENTATION=-